MVKRSVGQCKADYHSGGEEQADLVMTVTALAGKVW